MNENKSNYIFHVISNTHWDREWRFPFQRHRQMLVNMIDTVLDILENEPDYRAFHLDSQSVVLEDYLEIRPQKEAQIRKFIRDRRLLVGPWYVLPDEFQVGGESLIRNLLKGHQICEDFGHVMKVGYSPFSWGQISQLPQIYSEFNIDTIMFYRGINSLESEKAEFIWEGPDGIRVLSSRFSTMPRYNFYFYIYRPAVHNEQPGDVEYKWQRGGVPFHFGDKTLQDGEYYLVDPMNNYFPENLQESVRKIIDNQIDDFTTRHIFWAEGHDSSGPNSKTVQIIKDINEFIKEGKVVHSTLEDYAQGLHEEADREQLPVVTGERRSSQYDHRSNNLYGYTTSARMYLKQENFLTEKWLQFYAEPFNTISGELGLDTDDQYLSLAWEYLLKNHPHDSIGGCAMDEVHEDMMYRFKQSREISQGVFERAAKFLAKNIDFSEDPEDSIHLVAINPNTFQRDEITEIAVDIPQDLDEESINIIAQDGEKLPTQLIEKTDAQPVLEQLTDRPMYFDMKRYRVYAELSGVPSLGFSGYRVQPAQNPVEYSSKVGRLENGLPVLENDFLQVEIQQNGTLNIADKVSGQDFSEIGYFYDEGEAGHAWVNTPTEPFIDTLDSKPKIELIENGPLVSRCRIIYSLEVPKDIEARKSGNGNSVVIPIEVIVALTRNSKRVDFEISLENIAKEHRLRMMFPTDIDNAKSYGEGQFDVVERSTERPDTSDWVEQPMYDYPMHQFVDVSNTQLGAAVLVDGLKEYEVLPDENTTLAITLLRAFTYSIPVSSMQEYPEMLGTQCLGEQNYRLSFYPHRGDWNEGDVYREALNFNNELRVFQMGRPTGDLNPVTSFLQIEPEELIFSSLKPAEDNSGKVILRMYNPTGKDISGKIELHQTIKSAQRLTLEEKYVEDLESPDAHTILINVGAKKIYTVGIELSGDSLHDSE